MKSCAIILFFTLASFAIGGPVGIIQRHTCVQKCDATNVKFFYEVGQAYEYQYEAETNLLLNENNAKTRVTAKVVIQPVTTCEFVLTLKDVVLEGSPQSAEFASEVTRHASKFAFQDGKIDHICGSFEEPSWVLNFKNGILSTLQNSMTNFDSAQEAVTETDIVGKCLTKYTTTKEGSSIVVTKTKSLSQCSNRAWKPMILETLSVFRTSHKCTQTVNDHLMKVAKCTENFSSEPFPTSRANTKAEIFSQLELVKVHPSIPPITDTSFVVSPLGFVPPEVENEAMLTTDVTEILEQLEKESTNGVTKEVPKLFSKLITTLGTADKSQLKKLYVECNEKTRKFLTDALLVVETPSSTAFLVSLIMDNAISRSDQDAWVASLAFLKNPSLKIFEAIQPVFRTHLGNDALLPVSTLVHNYCSKHPECIENPEISNLVRAIERNVGLGCRPTSELEKKTIILTLKALGNIGLFINAASTLRRCYTEENPMDIRVAAIEAWRRTPCTYDRSHFLETFLDQKQENEIRIASYLETIKCPTKEIILKVKDQLTSEGVNQVTSFIWTHLMNLRESALPEKHLVGELVREQLPEKKFSDGVLKLSRNFESSFFLTEQNIGGMAEANVIFGSNSVLPKSGMFNLTVDLFGKSINLLEFGGRIEGFEKYIEKFFGPDGYYPEPTIEGILKNLQKQQVKNDLLEDYLAKNSDDPQSSFYFRLFGNELFYEHFQGIENSLANLNIRNPIELIMELARRGNVDFVKNLNFLDTEFSFPTIAGFPINLQLKGTASLGFKMDGSFNFQSFKNFNLKGKILPSAAIKVDTAMTVDVSVTKSGVRTSSTYHTSTVIDGDILVKDGKVVDMVINVPDKTIDVYDISEDHFLIENGKERKINYDGEENQIISECKSLIGLELCHYSKIVFSPSNGFATLNKNIYFNKIDSHSSYNFHYSHESNQISISLDMPGSARAKKWSLELKYEPNEISVNMISPSMKAMAEASYKFTVGEKKVNAKLVINDVINYSAKLGLINKKDENRHSKELLIFILNENTEIFNVNLKYDDETNSQFLHIFTSGTALTSASLKINLKRGDATNEVSIEIESSPLSFALSGSAILYENKCSLTFSGTYRLLNNKPQSITAVGNVASGKTENGETLKGDFRVEELALHGNLDLLLKEESVDVKANGGYRDFTFEFTHLTTFARSQESMELHTKTYVNCPEANFFFMVKKDIVLNSEVYDYDYEFQRPSQNTHIKAIWIFNKKIALEVSFDKLEAKVLAEKVAPGSYKVTGKYWHSDQHAEMLLEWTNDRDGIKGKLNADINTPLIVEKPVKINWIVDGSRNHLDMEGALDMLGTVKTITVKGTPTLLKIDTTFIRPFNFEATIERSSYSLDLRVLATSENFSFKGVFILVPNNIEGSIKFGETNIGLKGAWLPDGAKMDIWWSTTDRIALDISYQFGPEGSVTLSLETPFEGWKKQDASLSYGYEDRKCYSQLSLTWANTHHFTIITEYKAESALTDGQRYSSTSTIRVSSSLPNFERLQLTAKASTYTNKRINFDLEGDWNSHKLKGSFTTFETSDQFKALATFTSTFSKDFKAEFSVNEQFSIEEIVTNLLITYDDAIIKLDLNGKTVNPNNMDYKLLFSSPFVSEVSITYTMESDDLQKTITILGIFGDQKLSIVANGQLMQSADINGVHISLKADTKTMNLINFKLSHEINAENEFKAEFNINSEWKPKLFIDSRIESKFASLASAHVSGFIKSPIFNSEINLSHNLASEALQSNLSLSINTFIFKANVEGKIDTDRTVGTVNIHTESTCSLLNGFAINLDHSVNNNGRKSLIALSKGNVNFDIEHIIEVDDWFNWSNHLLINKMYGIDSKMSHSSGTWGHAIKLYSGEKMLEATVNVKLLDQIEIELTFDCPWLNPIKLIATHNSIKPTRQSKIVIEYGHGKKIFLDSEYTIDDYDKHITMTLTNQEWAFTPLVTDLKISTNKKDVFKLQVTSPKSSNAIVKYSSDVDIREIYFEITDTQKYFVHSQITGDLGEGNIKSYIYLPKMKSPLKTDFQYKFEKKAYSEIPTTNTLIDKLHSFYMKIPNIEIKTNFVMEKDQNTHTFTFILSENELNAELICPHGKRSFSADWKIHRDTGKLNAKFSPINSAATTFDLMYDMVGKKYIELIFKYNLKKYQLTGTYNPGNAKILIESPNYNIASFVQFSRTTVSASIKINQDIYQVDLNSNGNYKSGEAELKVTVPGYENNKIYLQHSFKNSKSYLLFNAEVGTEKCTFEYSAKLSDFNNADLFLSLSTPWESFSKLTLKGSFSGTVFKVSGVYNKYNFEWALKSTYDGSGKARYTLDIISNFPNSISFGDRIIVEMNTSQKPYSFVLTTELEHKIIKTYSLSINYDYENFVLSLTTPSDIIKTIELHGKFLKKDGYYTAEFVSTINSHEISFTGHASYVGEIPDIHFKLLTPFKGKETIELIMKGSVVEEKSVTFSVKVGGTEYLAHSSASLNKNNGKFDVNIKLPYYGWENISLNVLYDFVQDIKTTNINFSWNELFLNVAAKLSTTNLIFDLESSLPNLKSIHVACSHKKLNNGYTGNGTITKNGVEYTFQGKALLLTDGFEAKITLPLETPITFSIEGTLNKDTIKLKISKDSDIFHSYLFQVNYILDYNAVRLSLYTPFEVMSYGNVEYVVKERSIEGHFSIKRYSETYAIGGLIEMSKMNSIIYLHVNAPQLKKGITLYYDIHQETKAVGAIYETDDSVSEPAIYKYSIEGNLKQIPYLDAFIKLTSTYPFINKGIHLKFKWLNLNDIDAIFSLLDGEKTVTFSVKTQFNVNRAICLFETPIEGYQLIGFEAMQDLENGKRSASLLLADYSIYFTSVFANDNYSVDIKTPFKSFKEFTFAARKGWDEYNKFGILKLKLNNEGFEISADYKKSWTNPKIQFTIQTPFTSFKKVHISSTYNLELVDKSVDFSVIFNSWEYGISGVYSVKNGIVSTTWQIRSPYEDWRKASLEILFDVNNPGKLISVSLEREDGIKVIDINGKITDGEMIFKVENPFEELPNFQAKAAINRSKRSVEFMMMNDHHNAGIVASFNSLKVTAKTPFEKAREINLEISRDQEGKFTLHYKRNDNFIDFTLQPEEKKKSLDFTIKSSLPGWELLALAGRLDLQEIRSYIKGEKTEKQMEIEGSGSFSSKTGGMKITIKTPYPKYETVTVEVDFNSRRNILTFNAASSSSDFHILVEFKKGLTIDVFVPNPTENTVAKGKLKLLEGDLTVSSRFAVFRTLSIKYKLSLGAVIKAIAEYERNGNKIFELEFERNTETNISHLEIHGRLWGNHSMFHLHKEGWKKLEAIFNRNNKEFKVQLHGSGDIPRKGSIHFTIDNSFRDVPRHIEGNLEIDRTGSPKKLKLEVEYPDKKMYTANVEYQANLGDLKHGEFDIVITTPSKDDRPWKKLSGNWHIENKVVTATVNIGKMQFKISGKVGLKETSLLVETNDSRSSKYYLEWKIERSPGVREYSAKIGRDDRYVMFKLQGTFDTIWNGDVTGALRISRFMPHDMNFTNKWSTNSDGLTTGNLTFACEDHKGSGHYTFSRNAAEKASKFSLNAETDINNYKKINAYLEYSIKRRLIDFKHSVDNREISLKASFENFTKTSSSNVIYIKLPKLGTGEITLSHDFTNPLAKSIKAVGKLDGKDISYIINWTRNEDLTIFNLNGNVDSGLIGKLSLHADFDVTTSKDAKANIEYKRNEDKYVTIKWHRKRTGSQLEYELTFKSHFKFLPSARFHVLADWTEGFRLVGGLEWKDKKIDVNVDFKANKAVATIITPFEKFGNIKVNLDYILKGKDKEIVFKYVRGNNVIDLNINLEIINKDTGSLVFKLNTPLEALKEVKINGNWQQGVFKATYKRNDVQVDFEGTAEIKLDKSNIDAKFVLPNRGPVEISFAYDLEKFIKGTGVESSDLIKLDLKVSDHTIHFDVDGYRNSDKIFIEINGNTSLDKLKVFYLKLDSELNIKNRIGHFEVKANDFYYKMKNEFEQRNKGFYARSEIDSSLTRLPGLTVGFGKEADTFIATIGVGGDREISFSFKGKDHFKKGFSGKIDLPKGGINDLEYDVAYSFKDENTLQAHIKIAIGEGRDIEAEILYDSDGVKGRLTSPWTGRHSLRMRRSISEDHFLADIGLDNFGFTLKGNTWKKGFRLEGDFFGKKVYLESTLDINGIERSEGRIIVKTPIKGFETTSAFFTFGYSGKEFRTKAVINCVHKILLDAKFDLDAKIQGTAGLRINDLVFTFSSNLEKAENAYEGTILITTPCETHKRISGRGTLTLDPSIKGTFDVEINEHVSHINFSHVANNRFSNVDVTITFSDFREYKFKTSFARKLKPLVLNLEMSKVESGKKLYNLQFDLLVKSLHDISIQLGTQCHNSFCNFAIKFLKTDSFILGDIEAKIADIYEFIFSVEIPKNSSRQFTVRINKHNDFMGSLKITKEFDEPLIDFNFNLLRGANSYRAFLNYEKESAEYKTFLIEANSGEIFNSLLKMDKRADGIEIYSKINVHTFQYKYEQMKYSHIFTTLLQTPLFGIGEAKTVLTVKMYDDIEVSLESVINGKTHKTHARFSKNSFLGLIESPLLTTGLWKAEVAYNDMYFVRALISDTRTTYGLALTVSGKELSVEILTPFAEYEKIELGGRYDINSELSSINIWASPINFSFDCVYDMSELLVNFAFEMKTNIRDWELTAAEAYIPLKTFAPKLKGRIHGGDYEFQSRINESAEGAEVMVHTKTAANERLYWIVVKTQVPYEVRIETGTDRFGIRFDSSFLPLFNELYLYNAFY